MALHAPQSKDIAAAINSLIKLDAADRGSLLDTIEEYFTSPSRAQEASGTESDSDDEFNECEAEPETSGIYINYNLILDLKIYYIY